MAKQKYKYKIIYIFRYYGMWWELYVSRYSRFSKGVSRVTMKEFFLILAFLCSFDIYKIDIFLWALWDIASHLFFFILDSKFTQQELPACKPILTPRWVWKDLLCSFN